MALYISNLLSSSLFTLIETNLGVGVPDALQSSSKLSPSLYTMVVSFGSDVISGGIMTVVVVVEVVVLLQVW